MMLRLDNRLVSCVMFTATTQQATRKECQYPSLSQTTNNNVYLQVKNQSNNREEKDQKRPAKLTSDVTIRVHDFKDDNQIENQDDEANETTTVLEHIINHFVLFVYQKKKKKKESV